jgi:hypothetical protein
LAVRVRPATLGIPPTTPQLLSNSLANVGAFTAVATRGHTPARILRLHLELLHAQFLAWTTAKFEVKLMENPTLDPSDTLSGTAISFERLLKRLSTSLEPMLQAVEMLPMPPLLRGAAVAGLGQVCEVSFERQHVSVMCILVVLQETIPDQSTVPNGKSTHALQGKLSPEPTETPHSKVTSAFLLCLL